EGLEEWVPVRDIPELAAAAPEAAPAPQKLTKSDKLAVATKVESSAKLSSATSVAEVESAAKVESAASEAAPAATPLRRRSRVGSGASRVGSAKPATDVPGAF